MARSKIGWTELPHWKDADTDWCFQCVGGGGAHITRIASVDDVLVARADVAVSDRKSWQKEGRSGHAKVERVRSGDLHQRLIKDCDCRRWISQRSVSMKAAKWSGSPVQLVGVKQLGSWEVAILVLFSQDAQGQLWCGDLVLRGPPTSPDS